MHAQRTREVSCETALTWYHACYDMSRARVACVWHAAHTEGNFVISPWDSEMEGLGGRVIFFVLGTYVPFFESGPILAHGPCFTGSNEIRPAPWPICRPKGPSNSEEAAGLTCIGF